MGEGWAVNATSRPLYSRERDKVQNVQDSEWAPMGRSGEAWKVSPLPEFDPWTVQPVASPYTKYGITAHK